MTGLRVFVVEDHALVRQALQRFLATQQDLELVGSSGTAQDGLDGVLRTRPDVALLDLKLPDGDGIQICREIKSQQPETRCVVLTGVGESAHTDALLAGADAFITKDVGLEEVAKAIRGVGQGESVARKPERSADLLESLQSGGEGSDALTERERKVLGAIGRGLTNREIAAELHIAEQTVKNYVSAVLGKLGFTHRTQAAIFVATHPPETFS